MITIKSKEEIKIMKEGGRILAEIMDEIKKKVQVGITTRELDRVAESLIFKYGGTPAFKGYENFPSTLCASVNQVIVHGVPSDYKLKQGDILSLDLGIKYKGFFTDMAVTLPVKNYRNQTSVNFEAMRLIRVTKKALKFAIKKSKPGNTFGDIGNTIQRYVESQGFNVVRELCGHGIGKELHEEPQVLNYGKRHKGEVLKEGMTFCIEPMVTVGDWHIKKSSDGFGWETRDGSLSCHFEVTVAIGKKGAFVLTKI
ncbi:type I methionyl aminopeptidase [bacterium]|nr:type I methionyl aminopeptidase [bacterium]